MTKLFIFIFLFISVPGHPQQQTVLVFDLITGAVDSLSNFPSDTTKLSDKTPFYSGNLQNTFELLEQEPPVINTYPNTFFTRKKQASRDYDITKFPVRTSVKLVSKINDTLHDQCSGSMISRRHVITAAHCVSAINTNNLLCDSMKVYPAFDNGDSNTIFSCSWVRKVFFFRDWRMMNGEDFAILELEEPIGDVTGWLSIGFNSIDTTLLSGIFYKFSYPVSTILSIDSNEYNGDTLYYNYGLADFADENFLGIGHTKGIPGESGSSLIKVINQTEYTSYGVLSFSTNLRHSRLTNKIYYCLESIIHDDLTNAIPEPDETSFSIFPNPADEKARIKQTGDLRGQGVSLYDVFGRKVLERTITSDLFEIELNILPPGIYMVVLSTSKNQISKKIIIQRK